jgi:hypothetical protein
VYINVSSCLEELGKTITYQILPESNKEMSIQDKLINHVNLLMNTTGNERNEDTKKMRKHLENMYSKFEYSFPSFTHYCTIIYNIKASHSSVLQSFAV